MNVQWKGSPNSDTNRAAIDRIVIHWFGVGTLASANSRFQNKTEKASAHYGISDSIVWQWVKESNVAYHAGNYKMNQSSIGIEHDATTTKNASDETYATSSALVREICNRHNIPIDRTHIIGHKEIKATQCPGTLDLERIIRQAKGITMQPVPDWLLTMYLGLGIDLRKPEGEIRGRIQEIIDAWKDKPKLETRNKQLESEVAFNAGQAAQFEEELRLSIQGRGELEKELSRSRDAVVLRDSQINRLNKELGNYEDKVILSQEEYERLIKNNVISRFSRWELFKELITRR